MGEGEGGEEDGLDHNRKLSDQSESSAQADCSAFKRLCARMKGDSPVRVIAPSSSSNGATNWSAAISFRTRSIASCFCRRISQKSLIKHLAR